jgi:hypothetical protein
VIAWWIVAYGLTGLAAVYWAAHREARNMTPYRSAVSRLRRHLLKAAVLWVVWPIMLVAAFMDDLR